MSYESSILIMKSIMILYAKIIITRIDTETDVVTTFGTVSSEKNKWQGGVLAKNGFLYALPSNSRQVLCINTAKNNEMNDNMIELFGNLSKTKDKFQGKFSCSKSIVAIVILFNCNLYFDSLIFEYTGGFIGNDDAIYCIPVSQSIICIKLMITYLYYNHLICQTFVPFLLGKC